MIPNYVREKIETIQLSAGTLGLCGIAVLGGPDVSQQMQWYASLGVCLAGYGAYAWDYHKWRVSFDEAPEVTPEVTLEVAPEVTLEKTPERTPEKTPEEAPEEAPDQINIVDALLDAPEYHLLLAGGSGLGKTTLAKHVIRKRLEDGHHVIIVDPHNSQEDWVSCEFRKAHRNGDAYADAIDDMLDLAELRYTSDVERTPVTLFLSEWYAFIKSSRVDNKTKERAISGLQELIATVGKAFIFVVVDTHSATVKGLGFDAADIRDSFCVCLLSRSKGIRYYEIDGVFYANCGAFDGWPEVRTAPLLDQVQDLMQAITSPLNGRSAGSDEIVREALLELIMAREAGSGRVQVNPQGPLKRFKSGKNVALQGTGRLVREPQILSREPAPEPAEPRSEPAEPRSEPAEPRSEPAEPRSEPASEPAEPTQKRVQSQETGTVKIEPAEPAEPAEIEGAEELIGILKELGESEGLLFELTLKASQEATARDMCKLFKSQSSKTKSTRSRIVRYVRRMSGGKS